MNTISVHTNKFRSSDYTSDTSLRPKLVITYSVDPLVTISYDALSRPDTVTFANGVKEINTYDDNRGWLEKREYKRGATNIYTFASTGTSDFDKVGNLKQVIYTYESDPDTMEYDYDNHNRLIEFQHNNVVLRDYEYDDNGNITDFGSATFTYGNDNNQLTSDGTRTFTFDSTGRVTEIDTGAANVTLTYDIFNNMTAFGATETYTYDAANQRLRKNENGDSTYYFTNGLEVLAEYDENDDLQSEHIYGLGRMLAKFDPAVGHKFFYSDHLGSTRLVGGSSEDSTDMRRDYFPYGEELTTAGNDDTPFTFTGKELDSRTGLHYFGARFYDPRIGRWLAPDPLADKYPAWSPYNYVFDNPVELVDPFGLDTTVYFFDQAENPNNKRIYTAEVYLDVDGTVVGPFRGSTYPNDPKKHKTMKEGEHKFNNKSGHSLGTQKGLNIVDDHGNRVVPAIGPDGNNAEMTEPNVHAGQPINDWGAHNRGSAGCATICPADAPEFFENFDFSGRNNTTGKSQGKVIIRRGNSLQSIFEKTTLKVVKFIQDFLPSK